MTTQISPSLTANNLARVDFGAAALDRERPLAEQIAQMLGKAITERRQPPGSRLPSVRASSQLYRVSPSTVVAAYDRLQAQGLVEARQQRGFFVRSAGPATTPALTLNTAALPAPVDAAALIRGMFHGRTTHGGPGIGTLPEAWLDADLLDRALRKSLNAATGLRYGEPAGDRSLRDALSRRLSGDLGIAATADQIVTTVGATHALDLVARTLLKPGDSVLIDEPGWAIEFARLTRQGVRLLPVPRREAGPDIEAMRSILATHRPRLYVTVSVLHNPTGNSLSLASAHQVLKLAEAHDLTIVEDDTYAWLAPPHAPRLAALDGLQRTIYVSGFSKILAPDWRVGYMATSPALIARLLDTKLLSSLTTPSLQERAVAWCLSQGLLRRHAERVVQRLDDARVRAVALAQAAGCRFVTPPAGLFGWVDTGCDTEALAARMAGEGWLIAPGHLFHAASTPSTLMRLNFGSAQSASFWATFEGVRHQLAQESG
jgi:DNA-binding transcriptional MocR family regulator